MTMVKCTKCGFTQTVDTDDSYRCDDCGNPYYKGCTEDDFAAH